MGDQRVDFILAFSDTEGTYEKDIIQVKSKFVSLHSTREGES